jgi:hypothetical protein
MYVKPDELDREIREIRNLVADAVSRRDDCADRFCARPNARLAPGPRPATEKPAPPDDMIPAPPL